MCTGRQRAGVSTDRRNKSRYVFSFNVACMTAGRLGQPVPQVELLWKSYSRHSTSHVLNYQLENRGSAIIQHASRRVSTASYRHSTVAPPIAFVGGVHYTTKLILRPGCTFTQTHTITYDTLLILLLCFENAT